jgi:hypothetical protein
LETDAVSVASAADAARRLRSGERMLRVAEARLVRRQGVADPEGIELYEEALQLLDPAAVPLRALAFGELGSLRALQGFREFTDDVQMANTMLAEVESTAPKVAAAVRSAIVQASLGLPGAAYKLRLCDEALAVDPDIEDAWWDRFASGISINAFLHIHRGHSLMALGRRAEFERNLARVREVGETTGHMLVLAVAHARAALLALLDGRFEDVAPSANRIMDVAFEGHFRTTYTTLLWAVALEEDRAAGQLPLMEPLLAGATDLHAAHALSGRLLLDARDDRGAADALDHLVRGWTGWARNWYWPLTLSQTAEMAAGLGATEHAALILDELDLYSGELVVSGMGIIWLGAFDRYRGMMLGLLGRHDEAVVALTTGLALEESVESPTLTARTRYWLARALLERGSAEDRERAAVELDRTTKTADQLGMAGLARAGRELAERGA